MTLQDRTGTAPRRDLDTWPISMAETDLEGGIEGTIPFKPALIGSIVLSLAIAAASPALGHPAQSTKGQASQSINIGNHRAAGKPTLRARFFTINKVLAAHEAARTCSVQGQPATLEIPESAAREAIPIGAEPFDLVAFRAPDGALWVKWRALQAQLHAETELLDGCREQARSCAPEVRQFLQLVDRASVLKDRSRLEEVNTAVNAAIRHMSDVVQHGVPDVWSSPLATLRSGRGDCEDYAILKYFALRQAGVPAPHVRLLLVRDLHERMDHAVLAARTSNGWLVLDNRHGDIGYDHTFRHLFPLFAFDDRGVHLLAEPYMPPTAQPSGANLLSINLALAPGRVESTTPLGQAWGDATKKRPAPEPLGSTEVSHSR